MLRIFNTTNARKARPLNFSYNKGMLSVHCSVDDVGILNVTPHFIQAGIMGKFYSLVGFQGEGTLFCVEESPEIIIRAIRKGESMKAYKLGHPNFDHIPAHCRQPGALKFLSGREQTPPTMLPDVEAVGPLVSI